VLTIISIPLQTNAVLTLRVSIIAILILAIFTQTVSQGLIFLSYYTNRAAYEKYCINKARPRLHCNGQCQLAKKLKAEEERDKKDPLKNSSFSELVMICQPLGIEIATPPYFPRYKDLFHPLTIGNIKKHSASQFHPPSLTA